MRWTRSMPDIDFLSHREKFKLLWLPHLALMKKFQLHIPLWSENRVDDLSCSEQRLSRCSSASFATCDTDLTCRNRKNSQEKASALDKALV